MADRKIIKKRNQPRLLGPGPLNVVFKSVVGSIDSVNIDTVEVSDVYYCEKTNDLYVCGWNDMNKTKEWIRLGNG